MQLAFSGRQVMMQLFSTRCNKTSVYNDALGQAVQIEASKGPKKSHAVTEKTTAVSDRVGSVFAAGL